MARKSANLADTQLPRSVGDRFKSERRAHKITHEWLESVTGVPRTSIGRFENGKRGIHSDGLLLVLAKAAERGVNLEFVFTGKRPTERALEALSDPRVLEGLRRLGDDKKTGT